MDLQKLQAPIERQLALLGFELLLLEQVKDGRDTNLRIYLDHLDSDVSGRRITLEDCVTANDGLVAWMDVEFPNLREDLGIEISSPGVERPLVKVAHFRRFQGQLVRLQTRAPLNGQKRFKGWIAGCTDTTVTLEEDGVLKEVPLDILQKCRLAPFDEEKTPKPKHVEPKYTDFSAAVETSPGVELTEEV